MHVHVWPPLHLPQLDAFVGLLRRHRDLDDVTEIRDLSGLLTRQATTSIDALVVVPEALPTVSGGDLADVVGNLEILGRVEVQRVVAIVGDGYLGTDGWNITGGAVSAFAMSIMRSLALHAGNGRRANTICVPDSLFGSESSHRGPLAVQVELVDIVEAVAFIVGPDGEYVNGQTLYVNGGRHLFSSHSA